MNDYIFRGITQSNHKPSVAAYFEPRYNVTKDVQLYVGLAGASISFPNRAAAEVDVYGGIRPTFGMFAFDFGAWGYLYPGGHASATGTVAAPTDNCASFRSGHRLRLPGVTRLPINGNFVKKRRQLLRSLRQGELHHQRQLPGRRAPTTIRRTS